MSSQSLIWIKRISDKTIDVITYSYGRNWGMTNFVKVNSQNYPQTAPWLQNGYMCTPWVQVTWLFLLGKTYSNHCDVTVRFVTLNSSHTLHQNIHFILGKQIKINPNVLIRYYFENTNYLQGLNSLILNTPVFILMFVIIILIHVCFLKHFKSWT